MAVSRAKSGIVSIARGTTGVAYGAHALGLVW